MDLSFKRRVIRPVGFFNKFVHIKSPSLGRSFLTFEPKDELGSVDLGLWFVDFCAAFRFCRPSVRFWIVSVSLILMFWSWLLLVTYFVFSLVRPIHWRSKIVIIRIDLIRKSPEHNDLNFKREQSNHPCKNLRRVSDLGATSKTFFAPSFRIYQILFREIMRIILGVLCRQIPQVRSFQMIWHNATVRIRVRVSQNQITLNLRRGPEPKDQCSTGYTYNSHFLTTIHIGKRAKRIDGSRCTRTVRAVMMCWSWMIWFHNERTVKVMSVR